MQITLVTALYDLKRGELSEFKRSFDHYLECYSNLLDVDINLIVFGDDELRKYTFWENRRKEDNTQFIVRELDWFKNEFWDRIQDTRLDADWFRQAGWLEESPQAKLEYYNPVVMSKMALLHDAKILDKFDSDYMFWIDAGLSNTVSMETYVNKTTLETISKQIKNFMFVGYPYNATDEIHGFNYPEINEYAGQKDVNIIGRGGFFGGKKSEINKTFNLYYQLLNQTLTDGYMGTEESIFAIMIQKYNDYLSYHEIEDNGLVYRLFQDTIDGKLNMKMSIKNKIDKIALYVLGFNSPKQFETLINSIKQYDENLLNTDKYLINNSDTKNQEVYDSYTKLCNEYGFTEIQEGNKGICGGRQYAAEHFNDTDNDAYLFFEDDMSFYLGEDAVCRNGMQRRVSDILSKSISIISNEGLHYLKLNFTEFFGDNAKQWAWHNVPVDDRKKYWKTDEPNTKYKYIKYYNGLAYALGEVYYCNWPQIITREGNKLMFLDTKWDYPYEQTWMSHIFGLTRDNKTKMGILLATPTEHDRFEHYDKELRREN